MATQKRLGSYFHMQCWLHKGCLASVLLRGRTIRATSTVLQEQHARCWLGALLCVPFKKIASAIAQLFQLHLLSHRVAADILAYLRFSRSTVLLSLLREYAASSVITVEAVDPDALQAEVLQLFDLQNLNDFYIVMSQVDAAHAAAAAQQSAAVSLATSQGAAELRGRMLHSSLQQQQQQRRQQQPLRRLHQAGMSASQQDALASQLLSQMTGGGGAATAAASKDTSSSSSSSGRRPDYMSTTTTSSSSSTSATGTSDAGHSGTSARAVKPSRAAAAAAAAAGDSASSSSSSSSADSSNAGVQTLLDMVCAAAPWAPAGSLAKILPAGSACPVAKPLQLFQRDTLAFTPITVPVVFHVLRFAVDIPALSFMSTDMPQAPMGSKSGTAVYPPIWNGSSSSSSSSSSNGPIAGQNLVDAANRMYQGTGIQFSLQEVRTDVAKYPYLLQKDKSAWLQCSHNAAATAEGVACLQGIARLPEVAALAEQERVINVLVSGSDGRTDYTYCSPTAAEPKPLCSTTSRGYTAARGPWFLGSADPAWSEDASDANWVFLSWGNFDTASWNKGPWNGGGATLAHELG
jgi:hypothetical protein